MRVALICAPLSGDHLNLIGADDADVTGPCLIRACKCVYERAKIGRSCGMDSKNDNTRPFQWGTTLQRNLPEVIVERKNDARLRFGDFQQTTISPARVLCPGPTNVMAGLSKLLNKRPGKILVCQ